MGREADRVTNAEVVVYDGDMDDRTDAESIVAHDLPLYKLIQSAKGRSDAK